MFVFSRFLIGLFVVVGCLGVWEPMGFSAVPTLGQLQADCLKKERAASCAKAGVRYEEAGKLKLAATFYAKACKAFIGSIGSACYLWGRLIKDPQKAYNIFLRACTLRDPDGCSAVGDAYMKQKKAKQAVLFYKQGCDGGDGRGCHRIAKWLFKQKQNAKAVQHLKRSCVLGYSSGCGYLGWFYETKQKKLKKAEKAFRYGCEKLKGSIECARLGLLLYKLKKPQEGLRFLRRSCRLGFSRGCSMSRRLNKKLRGH